MSMLVAYLATSGGRDAVALGAGLARSLGTGLDLVMVLPPQEVPRRAPAQDFGDVLEERAQEWLAEAGRQARREEQDLPVTSTVLYAESVTQALVEQAERSRADMLVVGGSGGGLVGSHSLGAVVNELLHSSPVPVALAPRGFRHTAGDPLSQVTCAVGVRAGADRLVAVAESLAGRAHCSLRLLSLVALDRWPEAGPAPERLARAREHAEGIVQRLRDDLPPGTLSATEVVDGDSVEHAMARVDFRDGDLLVVGSSRLAQPRRLFLGSTAARMLRTLRVPLVVVPADPEPGAARPGREQRTEAG